MTNPVRRPLLRYHGGKRISPVLYEDLYGDWTKVERTALADGTRKRTEVLWLNQKASSGIQMDLLER